MFTGMIEEVGTIETVKILADSYKIKVKSTLVAKEATHGDSIAVNGICLTLTKDPVSLKMEFDAVKETIAQSTIKTWEPSTRVNLERALEAAGARLEGHIVQGHVDGVATIVKKEKNRAGMDLHLKAEHDYLKYIVKKGSICIDGVSLTIADIKKNIFRVSLVPYTLEHTNLGTKSVGDVTNIETDIIGRYVEQFMKPFLKKEGRVNMEFLKKMGFSE